MDIAYGDAEIYKLRDMVHEYYIKEVELWVNTEVDAIHLEEIGVNAVNTQLDCMDVEKITDIFHGNENCWKKTRS